MSSEIQSYQSGAPVMQFDQNKIDTIRNTVAKNANNNELEMFLHLCKTYNLDPFRKEIWFIKYNQNDDPKIMTSRDGYLKIAQQHPDYQGLMSQEVRENDHFELDAAKGSVVHKFAHPISKRGAIVGAWASAKRKGFDPVSIFVNYDEYKGNSPTWRNYPSAMIIKVAETFALKRQFGITGLVTREEMDAQIENHPEMTPGAFETPQNTKASKEDQKAHSEPPVQSGDSLEIIPAPKDVQRTFDLLGWTPEEMISNVNTWLERINQPKVESWKDLKPAHKAAFYQIMLNRLQKMLGADENETSQ